MSDGRLTFKSLAAEASLPRAYLYRDPYKLVAQEFAEQAKFLLSRTGEPDERIAEIERLGTALKTAKRSARKQRRKAQRAREELRTAANQIAYLAAQNSALREQLRARSTTFTIRGHRTAEPWDSARFRPGEDPTSRPVQQRKTRRSEPDS